MATRKINLELASEVKYYNPSRRSREPWRCPRPKPPAVEPLTAEDEALAAWQLAHAEDDDAARGRPVRVSAPPPLTAPGKPYRNYIIPPGGCTVAQLLEAMAAHGDYPSDMPGWRL